MAVVAARPADSKWPVTADTIAGCLARNTFANALCVVDRCNYLPAECDLLVVAPCLRYIDVEIKVSRADLKADRSKSKWWDSPPRWRYDGPRPPDVQREWPRSVWKHYYAMPATLWKTDLMEFVHPNSGVLLVHADDREPRYWRVEAVKRAKPCRGAKLATPESIAAIARLASLRMWDAYARLTNRVSVP